MIYLSEKNNLGLGALWMIILVIFSCQAYSVYDEEVGYCQGLSFLSAVLLLHVNLFSLPIGYIV